MQPRERRAREAQRRAQQAQDDQSGGAEQQCADAEGVDVADRTGQVGDPGRDGDHPVDAEAHQAPQRPIESERHRHQRQQAGRHRHRGDDRHCQQVGEDAIGRQPVKVIGRIGHGRKARHQGSQHQE